MGNYALGLGVVKALSQGMEGKFRDRLSHAQALNPSYELGAMETAWGRFYDKLPWPKRDRKKAEEHLRKAIEMNPNGLRPRVYLASSLIDADRVPEAKRLLDEVIAAVPGHYDAPEERRAQALAQGLMPTLLAKLK
jgi:tetratricopeptide (TPR) repeat protein